MRGNTGINNLAQAISLHVQRQVVLPDWLCYATIQPDLSLAIDGYRDSGNASVLIPKGQYYVLDWLTQPDPMDVATGPATAGTAHTHSVPRPLTMGPLVAGDRVLVGRCNGGNDVVVLGRLRSSS